MAYRFDGPRNAAELYSNPFRKKKRCRNREKFIQGVFHVETAK